MTKTEHFSVKIANKPGEGARVLGSLRDAGVNFTGIWGYQKNSRAALLELLPQDGTAFTKAAKKLGLDFSPALSAFVFDGLDHPGAVAESLQKLAGTGINVVAVQALCGGEGRYGAAVMVATEDARKAAKALGA
jgi:hypothetical protein